MTDLLNYKPKTDTVTVTLTYKKEPIPNDDGTPMTIEVCLPHSKQSKGIRHEMTNRRLKKLSEQEGDPGNFTAEELEETAIEILSKSIVSWNITFGGEKPELTVAKAKEVLTEVFWIKDQIEEAINKAMDFTKG